MNKRFILVRHGNHNCVGLDRCRFPLVVIHDKSELVDHKINGIKTRIYKPISQVMNYLDAYPIMKRLGYELDAAKSTNEQA